MVKTRLQVGGYPHTLNSRDKPLALPSTRVPWIVSRLSARRKVLLVSTGRMLGGVVRSRGIVANLIGVTPEKAIKLAVNDFVREMTADEYGNVAWYNGILAGASRFVDAAD